MNAPHAKVAANLMQHQSAVKFMLLRCFPADVHSAVWSRLSPSMKIEVSEQTLLPRSRCFFLHDQGICALAAKMSDPAGSFCLHLMHNLSRIKARPSCIFANSTDPRADFSLKLCTAKAKTTEQQLNCHITCLHSNLRIDLANLSWLDQETRSRRLCRHLKNWFAR